MPLGLIIRLHTSSLRAFIIHSAPLLSGASLIIPTSANSEQTRMIGRCLVTRVESSFSRCSGVKDANVAREGAAIAADRFEIKAGVKVLGKRW